MDNAEDTKRYYDESIELKDAWWTVRPAQPSQTPFAPCDSDDWMLEESARQSKKPRLDADAVDPTKRLIDHPLWSSSDSVDVWSSELIHQAENMGSPSSALRCPSSRPTQKYQNATSDTDYRNLQCETPEQSSQSKSTSANKWCMVDTQEEEDSIFSLYGIDWDWEDFPQLSEDQRCAIENWLLDLPNECNQYHAAVTCPKIPHKQSQPKHPRVGTYHPEEILQHLPPTPESGLRIHTHSLQSVRKQLAQYRDELRAIEHKLFKKISLRGKTYHTCVGRILVEDQHHYAAQNEKVIKKVQRLRSNIRDTWIARIRLKARLEVYERDNGRLGDENRRKRSLRWSGARRGWVGLTWEQLSDGQDDDGGDQDHDDDDDYDHEKKNRSDWESPVPQEKDESGIWRWLSKVPICFGRSGR